MPSYKSLCLLLMTVLLASSGGFAQSAGNREPAASSGYKIDHPLDPENKYLYHSAVESPDMMNLYNGVVTLDRQGTAWVELPNYFEALNNSFRYFLTPIGMPGPNLYIAQEIFQNRFKIAGGKRGMKVSWQVTGIRQDAYANAHRFKVEEEKPASERGRYLYPDVFAPRKNERPANARRKTAPIATQSARLVPSND